MSESEPRYTLAEARRILCRERGGHDLEQIPLGPLGGRATKFIIQCSYCRATFKETR